MRILCIVLALLYQPSGKNAELLQLGIKLQSEDKPDSALLIFNKLTTDEILAQETEVFIKAQQNIGRIYGDKGDNVTALKHYQQALLQAEKLGDKKLIAPILKNMGVLYISWKRFDQALEYYDQAEQMAKELDNRELIADCQNNKGTVYEQQEKYDEAIVAYKQALEVYTEKNIPGKIAMALSNVAIVYKYQKNYEEALKYNFKAIALAEQTGNKWNMAATYNNIGNLYGAMGNYREAIQYCEKALVYAKEIGAQEILWSIYDSMGEAAVSAGDYKSAVGYYKLFMDAKDHFMNTEYTRQLSELNVKYESEKNQTLIHQQQFEITRKNYLLMIASIIFVLLALTGYFVWRNYRNTTERKLQAEIFRRQEIESKALFEGEQNERIRIARDLHDGVGQMLSVMKMNLSSPTHSTEKMTELIDKTIHEVRSISHNLLPEELNFGMIPALESLAEKVNLSGTTKMEINISDKVSDHEFERRHQLSIYRITQEIVNNIIKHAEATLITLSLQPAGDSILLSIRDNGKGITQQQLNAAYAGIGWKNINARVHLLDGKIKVQSNNPVGTQIDINLPA